jgi:hypothetical protein
MQFPNTFRMFAQPLTETFGRRFVGVDVPPADPDPRPTMGQVADRMQQKGLTKVALIEVVDPTSQPSVTATPDPRLAMRTLGTVRIEIPMLDRPVWRQPTRWRFPRFRLVVHEVTLR